VTALAVQTRKVNYNTLAAGRPERTAIDSAAAPGQILDMATGQTSGLSAPITYMLDGKQYIAFMGGTGAAQRGRGGGGGGGRGGRGAAPAPTEPTATTECSEALRVYATK